VGHTVVRDTWRVVTPIYVAESNEQALSEVSEYVLPAIVDYIRAVSGKRYSAAFQGVTTGEEAVKIWTTQGLGPFGVLTIGTPDDICARIRALQAHSGGFGTFLLLAHNSANWQATRRNYELFARYVMPQFQHSSNLQSSLEWVGANSARLVESAMEASARATREHIAGAPGWLPEKNST